MTIRLTGILPNPFGDPCPKALIRFTAIATEGGMLKGVDAIATTDKNGSYDFTLEQGRYLLEIQYSDEYQESGSVLIDEASPDTMTLQELIRYTTPYTPPLVDDTPADWVSLFEGVLTNPDWQHEYENQVRNEEMLVNTDKVISSKDSAQLAQETRTTTTGSVKSANQSLAYEGSGKEAAYNKSDLEAGNLSASSGSELYSESTGSKARQHSTLQSDTTTSERVQQITDTNVASQQKDSVGSHTALHRQEVSDSQATITESVSDGSVVVTEKKVIDANALVTALIEQGVTIENVEAFDRLIVDADGSSRQIQVDEFKVGNTFEVDTKNDVVQVRGQLKISNGEDYRGPVGNSQYYEYAYATQEGKDINDWHIDNPDDPYDLPQGTVWRKHRMVTIIDGKTTKGNWSEPYLLTGKDGAEGDTLYWVYMYSADNVLTDPSAEVPVGWSSALKDGHLYRIERLKNKGVYEGVWSTPAKIAGADGDNGELVFEEYMYSPYGTSTPDNDTQGHWHSNFTSGDFYRSSRLTKYAAGTPIPLSADAEPIEVTAWTTPALITPRKGFEYSDGLSQIVVHMYIRSQSAPALPTATLTYDFNTFTLSGDKAGWTTEIPKGTGNLWLTIATASSNTGSDDIAPNEWTAPQLSATQAYNQASLSLYKRSPVGVVPDAPSTTLTYDFTTGVLTGDLEGWSNGTIPAGAEDLYIASAAVRSQTNTAGIEPEYWGVGILTSTAFRQQTVNIYKRGNATPPSADVIYNFTNGSVTGLSEGWALDIPSGSEDVFIGVAVASASGVTDIIKPADWSIGPLGTSGHQAVVLNLYMSSQTKPQKPQAEITYDFTQGKVVSDIGLWSTSVPQNTEGKIYVTTATANASALAQTDVIPVGEWTDPQVILESGVNAIPVTLYRKHALDSVPSKHTNDLTYSFDNAGLVNQPNNNWKATPMSVELGEAVWSMTATAQGLASDSTDVIEPTEFSDPVIYTTTGSEVFTAYQYAESETGPWFDDFIPARVWRIQGTSINGVVNDWSDPVKMTGEDGAVGDTIYFEYNYSEDLSEWHPVLVEGDIWRRERIVNNGVAGEWSSPARLKGNEQYIEYQYSASLNLGEAGWHSNFSSGDYYRRERFIINGVAGSWTNGVQIVPLKDVDYSDGVGGDTIYEVYQYSVDGLTEWEYDFEDHHIYRRTAVVINGALGAWSEPAKLSGIDGAPGDTIYMEYEYSADGLTWHKDMQDGDIWRHEREHTVGVTVPTDPWGNRTRIRGVDGAYYEYLYNEDNDNYPTSPEDDLGTWHSNFSDGDYYRIERLVQESSVGDWTTPTKLKPKKGEDYNDGIQGPKGEDGVTTYTWLKYADDASGSNMTDSPVGKAYMGLAYNKTTDEESNNPNDYAWSKVEGDQGVAGESGYMWVRYSNHGDGMNGAVPAMSQNPIDEATGRPYMYIGISYNNPDPTEGNDPTEYTWSKYIGDEIYYEYSYSPDKITWDMTIDENDIWRRERRVENGQYGDWSDAIRIVGTEGPKGADGQYYEDEFSITGDPQDGEAWHYPAFHKDKFKRTRLIDSEGEPVVGSTTDENGWVYTQIAPIKDVDYGDGNSGDTIYEVYQYSVNGIDNWEDDFKDTHVFRRTTVVINGAQSDWSAAARIMGNDGANGLQSNVITLYQVKQQKYTWLPQELIQTEEVYNIISGSFVGYDTESGINGWMLDVPAVLNEDEALYQVRVAALSEAGQLEVTIPADDWAAPVQITANGVSGSDGKHGSGSYIVNWEDTYNGGNGYTGLILTTTSPLSEGYVEYWFQEISDRESQAGDLLTIQQPEVDLAIPAQWLRSDSAWEKFTLTVDGAAVVNGTLAAEALKSETAITDILYVASNASRTELTLSGSGGWADGAGNVVDSSNYRQWVGDINPDNAPYSVKSNGEAYMSKLIAESAYVKGHIEANSGYFKGRIEAESGYFKGEVYVENLQGDVNEVYDVHVPKNFNNTAMNLHLYTITIPGRAWYRKVVLPGISIFMNVGKINFYRNGALIKGYDFSSSLMGYATTSQAVIGVAAGSSPTTFQVYAHASSKTPPAIYAEQDAVITTYKA